MPEHHGKPNILPLERKRKKGLRQRERKFILRIDQ